MSKSIVRVILLFHLSLIYCLISVNARPENLIEAEYTTITDHDKNSTTIKIPTNFDLRDNGAVTGVKDQGNCDNSDWAFAAVGALETYLFLKNNTLVDLSAQELIDCSNQNGNYGCDGGDPRKAFNYIEDNGIRTEESYPYRGKESKICDKEEKGNKIAKNSTIILTRISPGNETEMKKVLHSNGPILAVIDAYTNSFMSYERGIYYEKDCDKVGKHNVLIVGYGVTDKQEEFWIVKNSWGKDWGENGYIRMGRNKNTCGIANNATQIEVFNFVKNPVV